MNEIETARVMLVVHHFPPSAIGGAGLYAYELARELVARGLSVSVFTASNPSDNSSSNGEYRLNSMFLDGIQINDVCFNFQVQRDPFGTLLYDNPAMEQIFSKVLLDFQPDIVHIISFEHITPAILRPILRRRIPTVFTITGKWLICPKATLLRSTGDLCEGCQSGYTCARCILGRTRYLRVFARLPEAVIPWITAILARLPLIRKSGAINLIYAVERRNKHFPKLLRHLDVVFSPSKCHKAIFESRSLFGTKQITLSSHGHNLSAAENGQYKSLSKRIRFGYTGNLLPHKGVDLLLEAFLGLETTDAELLIFGNANFDSAFVEELYKRASESNAVQFRGAYSHDSVGSILQEIDVVVVPSTCIENAPLVIAEAHISKTPVIGSDTCGVAEWIRDGIDGLLFERGNADDLRSKMQWLLDDPNRLTMLSGNAPAVRTMSAEVDHLVKSYLGQIQEHQHA